MFRPIWEAVAAEFSGDGAWDQTHEVWRRDRLSTARAFGETADYLVARLKDLGLIDIERIPFKADGRTFLGDWTPSPAWDADAADLTILEPVSLAGRVCRYPDNPICLGMNSAATPADGVTAELVDAARVTDRRSLRGAMLLTTPAERPREVRGIYAKRGVVGIVSDWKPGGDNPGRRSIEPEGTYWENVWHEPWGRPRLPVFKIPPKTGDRLRAALKSGKRIVVKATVKARNYNGRIDTVTGVIPGRSLDEEIVCVGHVYEIGANDNASGAGCMLELARVIRALLKARAMPRLRRSIRFVFPWECYGSLAYALSKTARRHTALAGINADMVGNDLCLCGSSMEIGRAPDCTPSPANALIGRLYATLTDRDPTFRWYWSGVGGDDGQFYSDPAIGAATPVLVMWPDRFYHSNQDTMEKVSRTVLTQNGTVIGTYLAFLATAGRREALWLANETYRWSRERIEAYAAEVIEGSGDTIRNRVPEGGSGDTIRNRVPEGADPAERFAWLRDRGIEHIRGAARFLPASQRERFIADLAAFETLVKVDVVGAKERVAAVAGPDALGDETPAVRSVDGADLVPVRLVGGPPCFDKLTPDQRRAFTQRATGGLPGGHRRRMIFFLCDGRRTIAEINAWLRGEFGTSDLRKLVNTFRLLDRFGYVKLG